MASERIGIVLVDDHRIVRSGLRRVLEAEDDMEILAEAGDLATARRYLRGHRPQVLVLDLSLPDGPSLPAIPDLRRDFPETQIVVLTMHTDTAFAREALGAGALGYVLKHAAESDLVEAIRLAAGGESYLYPQLGARLASELPPPHAAPDDLSPREVEVLGLLALGHTNAEIAERLYLSVRTVESHRAHIQRKVRLSRRADLVRYAHEHGLVPG